MCLQTFWLEKVRMLHVSRLLSPITMLQKWHDTTIKEMKVFFGCRVAIKMLIHKDSTQAGYGHPTTAEDRLFDVGLQEVERAEPATTNNRCVVCMEKHRRDKRANPNAQYKDLPKLSKTIFWCNHCKVFLCIWKTGANR
uniref:Uncharacterized protein n=1 Tax=Octopus bimaculoides TaxID=37653 RepID=A0A0L8G7S8_OCTBM